MVKNSGTPPRAHAVRSLNRPRLLAVETASNRAGEPVPVAVIEYGERRAVVRIEDSWAIADEWWLRPVRRRYFRVMVEGEIRKTVYHDQLSGAWYAQAY